MRRIPAGLVIISVVWLALMFIAPLTLESGTVDDLDGGSGRVDNGDVYEDMNPFAHAVYAFGDYNCHQRASRSLYVNDNQMPLCSRDIGLMIGLVMGTALLFWTVPCSTTYHTILTLVPANVKRRVLRRMDARTFILLLGSLLVLPMVVDGSLQFFTGYESTLETRLFTGIPAGFVMGVGLGSWFVSSFEPTYGDRVETWDRYRKFLKRREREGRGDEPAKKGPSRRV